MVLLMSLLIRVLCESSDCMAGYSTLKVTYLTFFFFFPFLFVCLDCNLMNILMVGILLRAI